MKKKNICMIMLLIVMIFGMQTAFAADGEFPTATDLWNHWQIERQEDYDAPEPYPEYITGVWTDDNMATLTFGITKDEKGEAGKQEILSAVEQDHTVKFVYQTYPYNELWAIQLKLQERMGDETGVFGMGIYEMGNYLHIDIDMTNENAQAFMDECFAEYGNRIIFERSDGFNVTAEEAGYTDTAGGKNTWMLITAMVIILIAGSLFFIRIRPRYSAQTAAGTTVETDGKLTARQTEELIKDSAETPEIAVLERIREEIGKE